MAVVLNRYVVIALCISSSLAFHSSTDKLTVRNDDSSSQVPLEATNCSPFTCKTSTQDFKAETCAYYDGTTYYTRECNNLGEACLLQGANPGNFTCQIPPTTPSYSWPGETCEEADDCNANYAIACFNGICLGSAEGETCTVSDSCDPGFSCQGAAGAQKCTAQIAIGKTGCATDFDCVNNAGCNVISTVNVEENICVAYWTIKPHKQVGSCTNYVNQLCVSGYCSEGKDPDTYFCTNQFKSSKSIPMSCDTTATDQCLSNGDGWTGTVIQLQSPCECAKNKNGGSYCSLMPGDSPFLSMRNQIKKWYASGLSANCNTVRRDYYACLQTYWDAKNIEIMLYRDIHVAIYPEIQKAEDCVVVTFFSTYVTLKDILDSSAEFMAVSALIFAIIA